MAVKSTRSVSVQFTGDFVGTEELDDAVNTSAPVQSTLTTLSSGANTITVPTGAAACTIIPPSTNTNSITLKGVTGDTGVSLHLTDPTTVALGTSVTTFCLTAGATIADVRLLWS
jgi:hypothetical protein